jgi:predicted homoserine dehydrogenase-like protein
MMGLNDKLRELEENNKHIKVALVGAGLMGKGMVSQMTLVKGIMPSLVIDRTIDKAIEAYALAGVSKEDILVAKTLKDINIGMERDKFIVCNDIQLAAKANLIDVVVDATGKPDAGAKVAMDSIMNNKHIVMLNVEADMVVGPILNKLAKSAGVVYTGTAGDEPGSVKEIYDFAEVSGFEILAIGKGKNNPIDYDVTPDSVRAKAMKSGLKPSMLAGFIDGTNTMIEMTVMANATGFTPDIRGGHGPKGCADDLPGIFSLKEEGGILNRYGVVDYVRGIAPGVFAIVTSKLPQVHSQMKFLSMGEGPNYILYRPYHLTSLETPISIARAAIHKLPTIAPINKPICETVTIAKKDLKAGARLDGIGGYTVYGTIDTYETAKEENLLPIGLINENTIVKRDIKKGELITYDMVELDKDTMIYKLRQMQDEIF